MDKGELTQFPAAAGVYAVYSPDGRCQYIGLSRKATVSIASHLQELRDLTHAVRYEVVENPSREDLTAKWQEWVQAAVAENGEVPPGNAKGNTTWAIRRAMAKPEIKLTPGKGLQDLTCSIEDLLDQVVKSNKVVAFVKGTRTQPQCGFSHKVLSILNEIRTPYEVVNVLDETYNPGLREAIKAYSQWPTIPQLYIDGEFVGGADILEEMHTNGELRKMLST
ncbi:glutaredoxin [Coccomyxa subellipsoidea C-169]|uniref:Glutaredoxin n=1 Tax=Coccomyxa subellipsoidea (strain C-169) TaxID=574566 RepID=I0ZAZ6_COCSC|nr:glutaredoxin [Coccomyxa subellipsoidea C-169]EIE27815.1 glutaredoxin [Coccomyxa subellipsoidea C-169]|eukprot:XP_005652359.1 glutaredoxin [Coccomyxa subellipsoidea C-169]